MKTTLKKLLLIIAAVAVLTSCGNSPTPVLAEKTIIFYMVGDNNLSKSLYENAVEVLKAKGINYETNNVIIFLDHEYTNRGGNDDAPFLSTAPQIIRILPNNKYDEIRFFQEGNSCSAEFFKTTMDFIVSEFPAKSYGLILGSHGSGWVYSEQSEKSFGGDENPNIHANTINIPSIAANIPYCEFILFDACTMSSTAVLYEFRNKAKNILTSVYLAPGSGLDYEHTLPMLMKGDYSSVVDNYYFDQLPDGSVSLAWIKTDKLSEIAAEQRALLTSWNVTNNDLKTIIEDAIEPLQNLSSDNIEREYDLVHFIKKLAELKDKEEEAKHLLNLINMTIAYERHTNSFPFSDDTNPAISSMYASTNCGISTYLPYFKNPMTEYQKDQAIYFKTLPWSIDAGYSLLFSK